MSDTPRPAHVTHITATVRTPRDAGPGRWDDHRVGWLPAEGWFCTCEVRGCGHQTWSGRRWGRGMTQEPGLRGPVRHAGAPEGAAACAGAAVVPGASERHTRRRDGYWDEGATAHGATTACRCGHAVAQHWRSRLMCMASMPGDQVWCGCDAPEVEAEPPVVLPGQLEADL